jgi:hypothetical protein
MTLDIYADLFDDDLEAFGEYHLGPVAGQALHDRRADSPRTACYQGSPSR